MAEHWKGYPDPGGVARAKFAEEARTQMGNHWNDSGDLVIEEKTLFRHVGWLVGAVEPRFHFAGEGLPQLNGETVTPIYQQISTWDDGEGWHD